MVRKTLYLNKRRMNKKTELNKISEEIENCTECRIGKSGKAVVGEGSPDAKIMFVGEAPGRQEAATGRPFIGRSGQLLRSLIRQAGLKEEDVYITSPVKYQPATDTGGIRTPTSSEITHGKTHFDQQVRIIDPKILVLLGNSAIKGALGEMIPIKSMHGEVIERNGRKYFLTFHPAAGLRFPPLKKLLEEDFEMLPNLLKV